MALGSDFVAAQGSYVLATPTDNDRANERSGVWFLSLASGAPSVGLTLPALPAGWMYEGWAVVNGRALTTGRFLNARAADNAAPFSGPVAGPPFPGEDYLRNTPSGLSFPVDLRSATIAITIEPEPDDAPGPFAFKPLLGTVAATAVDHVTFTLPNRASNAGGWECVDSIVRLTPRASASSWLGRWRDGFSSFSSNPATGQASRPRWSASWNLRERSRNVTCGDTTS